MYRLRQSGWLRAIALLAAVLAARGSATSQTQYVITNDDPGVSFYTVSQGGLLTLQQQVQIGGFGTVAGFFGANRLNMLDGGEEQVLNGARNFNNLPGIRWLIETHSQQLEVSCDKILQAAGFQTRIIPNARWRIFVPELRPIAHNRWLASKKNE